MYADDMSTHALINYDVDRDTLQCDFNALYAQCAMWDL